MKKKIIRILTILAIASALVFIPPVLAESRRTTVTATEASAPVFTVRTENAEIRTLQAYIEVNANIISGHQVAVVPDANGRLVSMAANLGDVVSRGQLLAEVDPSRPGTVFSMSPVYAPVSGRVVSVPQTVGSMVSTATPLLTLAVNGSIEIEARIPEREVGQLRTGLAAEVRLEAFPGEVFSATLTQVSPVVDPVSRTKTVTLRFNGPSGALHYQRVSPGMFARVRLNTRTHENVVSIPQEALVEHRGRTVVYVLNTNIEGNYINGLAAGMPFVEMREISAGVNVNREVEVINGLEPGETVVVQGQQFLADGAPVRVIGRRI